MRRCHTPIRLSTVNIRMDKIVANIPIKIGSIISDLFSFIKPVDMAKKEKLKPVIEANRECKLSSVLLNSKLTSIGAWL